MIQKGLELNLTGVDSIVGRGLQVITLVEGEGVDAGKIVEGEVLACCTIGYAAPPEGAATQETKPHHYSGWTPGYYNYYGGNNGHHNGWNGGWNGYGGW